MPKPVSKKDLDMLKKKKSISYFNERLYSEFGVNYNDVDLIFKRGFIVFRKDVSI